MPEQFQLIIYDEGETFVGTLEELLEQFEYYDMESLDENGSLRFARISNLKKELNIWDFFNKKYSIKTDSI